MSLCFGAAFRAKQSGETTEEEYLEHLTAHFRNVRHPQDDKDNIAADVSVWNMDPVGASFRDMALKGGYNALQDTTLYRRLFLRCLEDNVDQVRAVLDEMQHQSIPVPLQPLATLAAANGRAEVSRICLDSGAVFDSNLDNASTRALESPAMLEFLWSVDWQDMERSKSLLNSLVTRSLSEDPAMLTWLLDHGAQVTKDTVKTAAFVPTRVSTMKILIGKCGINSTNNTCNLPLAARRGNQDMVQFLLDAGIDINGIPPPPDIREPGPYTALYEAVQAQHIAIVRLLLDRGARVDLPERRRGRYRETALELATRMGNSEIVKLFE